MIKSVILGALAFSFGLAVAQDDDSVTDDKPQHISETPNKKIPKNLKAVAKAIAEMEPVNAKANLKAKYYIYLISASWCGPCQALMPMIVEAYPAMKKKGVEILLVGADKNLDDVKKYAKSHNCKFPAVWHGDPLVKALPGITNAAGVPWAIYVNADGEQIVAGVANMGNSSILNWEEILLGKTGKKSKSNKKK